MQPDGARAKTNRKGRQTMTSTQQIQSGGLIMGKLGHGGDMLEEITGICTRENIRLGRIEAIGAVRRARLAYYDQQEREYRYFTIDRPLEITKLTGNVSIKEGKPMVHAHITLADEDGKMYGGHLGPGTLVFACELIIESFIGPDFERGYDEQTGLALWQI